MDFCLAMGSKSTYLLDMCQSKGMILFGYEAMNKKKLFYIAIYAIGMAYLEATIVVYLRGLYGIADLMTSVPAFDPQVSIIELGRELATLIMLLAVGLASGKRLQSQIGFALYAFGLWDIWYYIWLVVFIGCPHSLFDWDLLFLIPLPWWGPVIAPVMISVLMIIGGARLALLEERGFLVRPKWPDWAMLATGACTMLYAFMSNAIASLPSSVESLNDLRPSSFLWSIFLVGYGIATYAIWRILYKSLDEPAMHRSGRN